MYIQFKFTILFNFYYKILKYKKKKKKSVVFIMEIFLIFVLFWIMDLLIGACKMTVSVCAAIWYWKSNKTVIK